MIFFYYMYICTFKQTLFLFQYQTNRDKKSKKVLCVREKTLIIESVLVRTLFIVKRLFIIKSAIV